MVKNYNIAYLLALIQHADETIQKMVKNARQNPKWSFWTERALKLIKKILKELPLALHFHFTSLMKICINKRSA